MMGKLLAGIGTGDDTSESEPRADTGDDRQLVGIDAALAREIRGPSEFPLPMHADVRLELAADLVAQA